MEIPYKDWEDTVFKLMEIFQLVLVKIRLYRIQWINSKIILTNTPSMMTWYSFSQWDITGAHIPGSAIYPLAILEWYCNIQKYKLEVFLIQKNSKMCPLWR